MSIDTKALRKRAQEYREESYGSMSIRLTELADLLDAADRCAKLETELARLQRLIGMAAYFCKEDCPKVALSTLKEAINGGAA